VRYVLFVVKLVIYLICYFVLPISVNKDVCAMYVWLGSYVVKKRLSVKFSLKLIDPLKIAELHHHHRSIFLPFLCLMPQRKGSPPWNDLRKIFQGGQRMAKVHSGEEILPKGLTQSRVHQR